MRGVASCTMERTCSDSEILKLQHLKINSGRSNSSSDSRSDSLFHLETPDTGKSTVFEDFPDHPANDHFIAVVGGLGYIGSHTCFELLKAGHNVIIIDNLSNSFRTVYDNISTLVKRHYEHQDGPAPSFRFYEADYRNENAIREILSEYMTPSGVYSSVDLPISTSRIQGVVHFAAYKSVSESIKQPLRYYANNLVGMIDFCAVLNEFNIKTFVFSSSATVYGTVADSGIPLREEYCVHKPETFTDHDGRERNVDGGCRGLTNPYGRSKWMCEAVLSDLAVADPAWTIVALRYFNPVGCDDSGLLGEDPRNAPTNLMPVVLSVLTRQRPILNVYGSDYPTPDGTAVRDYIHVTDLALGHIAALSAASSGRIGKGFRTYNLGSGSGQSVNELVAAVETVSKSKIPILLVDRRAGDVGSCVAVASRAEKELFWKAERSLEDSCRDIVNYLDKRAHVVKYSEKRAAMATPADSDARLPASMAESST